MTPGFETEQERLEVAAMLGWIPAELTRNLNAGVFSGMGSLIREWNRLTDILLARIKELEELQELLADDKSTWPELFKDHPTDQCEGWR